MISEKKVILITGTSKGIGKYLSEHYIDKGYFVIGCSRGKSAIYSKYYKHFEIDISDESKIVDLFLFIRNNLKRLDVLINNAVVNPSVISSAFVSYEDIEKAYRINVFSTMIFCREAIKIMIKKKHGRIINIGSMVTKHETFGGILYSPTKSAINTYSKVLAKEVYKIGITVNVVAPSAIKTDLSNNTNINDLSEILSRNAITDFGELIDVSSITDFLIEEKNNSLTGQIIYLGGV